MARNRIRGTAEQIEFVKLFDRLTGKYSRWEVWKDMVWMIAIAISNRVDKRYFDSREQTYLDIVKKYSKEEVEIFSKLYGLLFVSIIERTDRSSWGDFLGELFMELNLGNELGGQFFTPYDICRMMSQVTIKADLEKMKGEIEDKGYISCYDSAVGAGAMLIAAAEVFADQGINYPYQVMFAAQEIDSTTALMCYIQLSMLGCAGYVVIGDTICNPATGHVLFGEDSERCWFTPMFFEETWHTRREIEIARYRFKRVMEVFNVNRDAIEDDAPPAVLEPATPPEAPRPALEANEPISPTPIQDTPRESPQRRGKQLVGQISLFDL